MLEIIKIVLEIRKINFSKVKFMSEDNKDDNIKHEDKLGEADNQSEVDKNNTTEEINQSTTEQNNENHITTPGHVFPIIARNGGTLIRAGHTEAIVDIAKICGLNPSGVICEIMKDNGEMARLPDLKKFAKKHSLKIGTIADLISSSLGLGLFSSKEEATTKNPGVQKPH